MIVVVVVGVVVVLAVLPLFEAPKTAFGSPFSFASFFDPANSSGGSVPGGPWTPVVALGVVVSSDERGALGTEGLGGGNCTPVWNSNSSLQLPATPTTAPPGEASGWFLFSTDTAGKALLTLATNRSGTVEAVPLVVVPGSCLVGVGAVEPLNGSIIDSSAAATTADVNGGLAFLVKYPGATEEFLAEENTWTVAYSTCPFTGSVGTGTEFVASVNALSGALLQSQTYGSVPCSV